MIIKPFEDEEVSTGCATFQIRSRYYLVIRFHDRYTTVAEPLCNSLTTLWILFYNLILRFQDRSKTYVGALLVFSIPSRAILSGPW
jgi:hypothetical protein